MRSHEAAKNWRRVFSREYPTRIDALRYNDVVGIGTGSIGFTGGVTAICGANGVGKSTLLDAVLGSLDPTHPCYPPHLRYRLNNASLSASVHTQSLQGIRETKFAEDGASATATGPAVAVQFVNPAFRSAHLISVFGEMENLDELLEGYEPSSAADDDLTRLSFLVGKSYDAVQTFEIDDYESETIPYFRVTSEGTTYGSESMGLGEMSLLLMLWYVAQVPSGSVLLIEEPETHLSPRSQSAILDVLAEVSASRNVWTILTTHCAAIVDRIPLEHIRLISRSAGELTILAAPGATQLRVALGMEHRYSGAILVEDRVSRQFVVSWLGMVAPDLLATFEVKDVPDAGVSVALQKTPEIGAWFGLVGLYDGDMRARATPQRWPHAFLPSDVAPEELLMRAAESSPQRLAEKANRPLATVTVVLEQARGLDHHDWLEEFARSLGLPHETLIAALVATWLETDEGTKASALSLTELETATRRAFVRPLPSSSEQH